VKQNKIKWSGVDQRRDAIVEIGRVVKESEDVAKKQQEEDYCIRGVFVIK